MSRNANRHFRRRYGASPLHLAGHVVAFAIAACAIAQAGSAKAVVELVALYIGFVILHDLVFLPAYSGLDRLARRALIRLPAGGSARVTAVNHIRAPMVISGVLLVIYLPLITGQADSDFFGVSGHHLEGYLRNWALITVVLFVGSGLIYALRLLRARAGAGAAEARDAAPRSLEEQI